VKDYGASTALNRNALVIVQGIMVLEKACFDCVAAIACYVDRVVENDLLAHESR
jgi:hypothetical protein